MDRPARPAAELLDASCRPRLALRRRSGPHRDRARADGGVPGQCACGRRTPRRLVVDARAGRRRGVEQPQRPVDRERERLRPLARDRSSACGPGGSGHTGDGLSVQRRGDGERRAQGRAQGAWLPRLAQPRGAAPGHPLGAPLFGALRARDRPRRGPVGVRAPGLFRRARGGRRHGVADPALRCARTPWRRRCGR